MCAWNVAHPGLSDRNNRKVTLFSPGTAQLTTTKAVCANVSSNTRAVEYMYMALTFGLEST